MRLSINNQLLSFATVVFIVLISISFWSFRSIEAPVYRALEAAALGVLAVIIIAKSGVFFRSGLNFKYYVLGFMFIPFLGVIGAAIYHDQSIDQSIYIIRSNFIYLFYFVLHILKVPTKRLIQLVLFVGVVWAFLTIAQQFTYPNYWFYSRDDEKQSIYRAGVYRYSIAGLPYGLFVLIFFFYRYLRTYNWRHLAMAAIGILGFYYYGTRQYALGAVSCMFFSVFFLKGNAKWRNLLLIAGGALLVLGFKEILFGEYIEMTNSQLADDDNIRFLSGNFYLNEYWPSWGAKLLGNGRPHHDSSYGDEIALLQTQLHFYRSDVGIIGSYNQYGIFYVLNLFAFILNCLFIKIKTTEHKYLHLFFLNALLLIITSEPFLSPRWACFYCIILYLIDRSIAEYKEKKVRQNMQTAETAISQLA